MSEQSWKPLFRAPESTVTKVLRSAAFEHSRERSDQIVGDADNLLALAAAVEALDLHDAPLSAIADRVMAATRLLRARAERIASGAPVAPDGGPTGSDGVDAPADLARERLIVAALFYLVTPVDLVPDFRSGGYVDDVLLLSWVFGAAALELEPYLDPEPAGA